MADLAGSVVFENHTPRFANMVVSHRPRARSVRFDLFEWIDGAIVPHDAPGDVLAVETAFDQGRD